MQTYCKMGEYADLLRIGENMQTIEWESMEIIASESMQTYCIMREYADLL